MRCSDGFWRTSRNEKLQYYAKNCTKEHQVSIDTNSFNEGYTKGKADLCTRDGGYKFGKAGEAYDNSCPKEAEDEFFIGYQRGQAVFTASKIKSLETQVTELNDELKKKQNRINELETKQRELEDQLKKQKR